MTPADLFALLFAMALGAALQGAYLWRIWRPADCRCPVHGSVPQTRGGGSQPPKPAAAPAHVPR